MTGLLCVVARMWRFVPSNRCTRGVCACVRACVLGVAVSSKQERGESPENPGVINSPDGLGLISAPAMVLLPRGPYLKLEAGIKVAPS